VWRTIRQWLRDPKRLGREGEHRAEQYLAHKGYHTLQRRFLCRGGEIDLVMRDPEGALVFVEVKARRSEGFQPIESVITSTKKARLIRAARYYITTHRIPDQPLRFDVVTVLHQGSRKHALRHYQNVFVP
jgi:putative endonuclease